MADNRSFPYALADNIIGFDDGYDTLLERGVKAVKKDPMGVAQQLGGALYDSAKGFAGDFVRNPAGTITDSMNNLGLTYVEAGKRLYGGIGSYLDQGMSVEEARDAQLMDSLTLSELGGFGLLANQLRKGLTPNVNITEENPNDPGRRKFLATAAATVPVAALAPDLITDVATQVAKRGPRGPVTSIFTSAAANIRELKRKIQDLQELRDDINYRDNPGETPQQTEMLEQDLNKYTQEQGLNDKILKDEYNEVFEMLNDDPVLIKNAPDDDLEFVLENVYEDDVNLYDVVDNLNLRNDMSEVIAAEIKKRKLHLQKDKNGVDKYPFAKIFLEDYTEINLGPISMPNPSMQMVRKADFADDFLKTNAKKINDKNIEDIIDDGKIAKESADEINKNVIRYAEKNNISAPRRAFDNPKVEYVSTQEISDLIPRGNTIKYNVSTYNRAGDDFYDPMSTEIKEFLESGQETLRESIHNDGIKEPIIIGVAKETGEVLLNEGHHRLHAALQMDLPEIPIVVKFFDKELPFTEFQSPALINTKGLKPNSKGYLSYSELDFKNKVIRPKAPSEQGRFDEFDRPTSNYNFFAKPETPEFDRSDEPLRDSINFPPMREGFFRRTDKKAKGGPIEGIASLNNVARDMYRGPRGIGTYQQFADGGAARTISEYRQSLFGTESFGGDTEAVNERTGALGASQAMPKTIGDFKKDTGESFSNEAFLKDPDLQEKFQDWFERKTLDYIADNGLDRFIGKQVKGIPVTLSGMMAMAHLGGNYGMRQFLETDGRVDPSDNPNNPDKGTKLSDYLQTHGGLNVYTPQPLNREALVMSQPVAPRNPVYSASFYNNPAFFQKPVPRPTELAPQQEEVKNAVVKELQTPSMVEKYGMPLQVPQGIGSLSETARLMYN